ncbi:MAG: DUF4129 domain-containing protein [Acidimicrobiia bacterium]|nr:DUF4129 domain-containing protein [Acidimicrobiia bacterium]
MNPVALLVALGGLAGWVLGSATGARPWFVAVVGAAVALEAASAARVDPDEVRAWRRIEILMLVIGVKAFHLLTVPRAVASAEISAFPLGLRDTESVTGWVVGLSVWLLATATLADVTHLGTGAERAEEVPVLDRLRHRLMAATGLLAAAAAYGAVGVSGLVDLERRGQRGVFWAATAFLGLGLLGLGRAAYANSVGRWERDGAVVEGPVRARWAGAGFVLVSLVVLAGLASSVGSAGVSALPAIGVSRMGPVGDWLAGTLDRLGGGEARQTAEPRGLVAPLQPSQAEDDKPGSIIGELFILAVLAASIGVAMRAGKGLRRPLWRARRQGGASGGLLISLLRGTLSILHSALKGLWSLIRAVFGLRRRKGTRITPARSSRTGAFIRWAPDDPLRARIAAAYRGFVGTASARGLPPSSVDTPREFARRVGPSEPVVGITTAYEEARYSQHVLEAGFAQRAEEAAAAAIAEVEER